MVQTYKTHVVLCLVALVTISVAMSQQTHDLVSAFSLAVADLAPFLIALIAAHWLLLRVNDSHRVRSKFLMHVGTILLGASIVELSDLLLWSWGIAVDRFIDAEHFSGADLLREYAESVFFSGLLWGSSLLASRWLAQAPSHPDPTPQSQANESAMGLLQEIRKAGMFEPVECLKAEGNYVDVIGATSHKLLAYRFARAVEEFGSSGIQVHRSYWVSRNAVSQVSKSGKSTVVVLKSGRTVPVSNTYLLAARSLASQVCSERVSMPGHKDGDYGTTEL